MAVKNSTILAKAWLESTGDYAQRVPSPTVATQKQTMEAIFNPLNGNRVYSEFVDTLFNRIGLTYAHQQAWRNPLAAFKRGTLAYGSSVQELATAWIKAHTYRDDAQTLLKVHRPEVEQAIHQLNRFDQYPLSVNKIELKQAFTDEYGLNSLVSSVMDSAINSEQYDEYLQMKELIAWYENTWGFFKINGDMPEDDTSSKAFLKSLRTMVAKLGFPSTLYNAGIVPDIPVFARPDELVLLISPEASASVDVDTLAALFNLEKAEAQVRQIIVDEFPIPGAYAMLTTEDWFQVYDQTYENGSFYNPETLTTNYYLTVMQVISCSPFVPAIVWTTEEGTETGTITLTTSNTVNAVQAIRSGCSGCFEAMPDGTKLTKAMVTGKNGDGTPAAVNGVYLFGELQGSLSDGTITGAQEIDGITVRPDAYVVRDMTFSGSGAPVRNSRTYIDRLGRLHLQAGAYKGSEDLTLTVTIEPTYNNPSGDTPAPVTTTVTFTIAAAGGDEPEPGHHDGADFVTFLYVNPVTGTGVTLSQEQLRDNPSAAFDETAGGALSSVMFLPATGGDLPAVTAASVTVTAGTKTATKTASFAYDTWNVRNLEDDITAEDYEAAGGEATVAVTITAGGEDYTVTVPVTIDPVPVPLTGPDFITEVTVTPVGVGGTAATISQADLIAGTASASFDTTAEGAISAVSFEPVGGDLPAITEARLDLTVGGQLTQLPMYPTVGSDDWTVSGIDSSISAADIAAAGGAISATIVLTADGTTYSDIHFALSVARVLTLPDFLTSLDINQAGSGGSIEDIILTQQQLRDNPSALIVTGLGAINDINMFKASDATLPEVTAASATVTAGTATETKAVADVSQAVLGLAGFASDVTPSDYAAAGNAGSLALSITAGGETYSLTIPVTVALPFKAIELQDGSDTVIDTIDATDSTQGWTSSVTSGSFSKIVLDLPEGATTVGMTYYLSSESYGTAHDIAGTVSGTTGTILADGTIDTTTVEYVTFTFTWNGHEYRSGSGTLTVTPALFADAQIEGSTLYSWDTVDMTVPWSYTVSGRQTLGKFLIPNHGMPGTATIHVPDGGSERTATGTYNAGSRAFYFDTAATASLAQGPGDFSGIYFTIESDGQTYTSETGTISIPA